MILTGKCKEDFEKWYLKNYYPDVWKQRELGVFIYTHTNLFYEKIFSMQYGVYVDFFLYNEMYLMIRQKEHLYSIYIDWHGRHLLTEYIDCETFKEARTKAIEKANEIYNE